MSPNCFIFIVLFSGGHEIILNAFDRFKDICGEKKRFQTLMEYFMNFEMFHIEFMVACTQVHVVLVMVFCRTPAVMQSSLLFFLNYTVH